MVLEALLGPVSPMEFRERYYGRQPLLTPGHPKKFADLFNWDNLNRLLNASSYPQNHIQLSNGKLPDDPAKLIEDCRAGASLIIINVHDYDPKLGEFTRALEAETGEPMNAILFLSPPSKGAFDIHYDRHDVFVLQMEGHKAWSVYEPSVEKPVRKMVETAQPPKQPMLECELAPGDVLYIPRGYWHHAKAQRGLSLHVTLGFDARTGIDFLTWLTMQLRSDVRFREELPLSFRDEPEEVRAKRLQEHVARLGQMVASRCRDSATIESFMRNCVISQRDVQRFKFPAQLLDTPGAQLDVTHFSRPERQRVVLHDGLTGNKIAVSVWGHVFHFPKNARPLLEFIVSRTAFAYEEALLHAGELTEAGIRDVLDSFLREGILDPGSPDA